MAPITDAGVAFPFPPPVPVLFIAIPVRNEAPTIGVLLWRIRTVFQDYTREFEVLVFDDGSSDATAEVIATYAKIMPVKMLGGAARLGYARAVDALLREAARSTRYPRRDAVILMQGDFTDPPEHIPDLVRRFEGGADVVLVGRPINAAMPAPERRLRWFVARLLRLTGSLPPNGDPLGTYRLMRLSTVRDLIKARGDRPLVAADGWAANVELLHALRGVARRVEATTVEGRYDVRPRPSRRRMLADAWSLVRVSYRLRRAARAAQATSPRPTTA